MPHYSIGTTSIDSFMGKTRKNIFGEVFTPPDLIDELLDNLPKFIWTNPDAHWLDPCAGQGNFFARVIPRLMDSLHAKIPQETARRKHIMTKMLTMVEYNIQNVQKIRKVFPEAAHVIHADFLDPDMKLPYSNYDVILANPPYQAPKHAKYTGAIGNHTLWDAFLKKAAGGGLGTPILGFITPSNWRRPEHPLYQEIAPKLLFLHIYSKQDGMRFFHVQTRFDIYVIDTTKKTTKLPKLIDEQGKEHRDMDMKDWPNFLPNYYYQEIRSILVNRAHPTPVPVIFHSTLYDARKLQARRTKKYKYPIVHTITKKGLGLRFTDHKDPSQFGHPKVILNANEKQYPFLDSLGKYGMSQLSFGIPIRSEAEGRRIQTCLNSPEFEEVIKATKWGSFQTDYRMFKYFRKDFCRSTKKRKHMATHE
jgi:N-6 DNA Methylase